jgi:hypothetical protein
MRSPAKRALLAVVLVAYGAAGCMEVEQSATPQKQGKYQGKPDGKSWENDPLAVGSGNAKWTKGDKVSWETQIKTRNNGQNEYKRIGD